MEIVFFPYVNLNDFGIGEKYGCIVFWLLAQNKYVEHKEKKHLAMLLEHG